MSSLKSIIVKYFTSNKFNFWIILLVILLILATLYAYNYYYVPDQKNKDFKNISNSSAGKTSDVYKNETIVTIYFFTVDWCPYCKKAEPEWNAFSTNYNNVKQKDHTIKCVKVDCTDNKDQSVKDFVKKYDIQGYPTVKMIKDGKVIDFDAKVTSSSLTQFVQNMV